MIRILVTGSKGQLGLEIRNRSAVHKDFSFVYTDIDELDITNARDVGNFLSSEHFDVIINCAGYTNVDKAEEEPEMARAVNALAVKNLAEASRKSNTFLVHISTDYVFNGMNHRPYTEEDLPDPLSAYARSKHEGEKLFMEEVGRGFIFRLSWLYSSFGKNFVKTILSLSATREEIRVVKDQVGSPTYSLDFVTFLLQRLPEMIQADRKSIYHYSNEGVSSWYDLAQATVEISGNRCTVIPIGTGDYPLPAKRPFYSLMDKSRLCSDFGITIPHWRASLKNFINQIKQSS